MSDADIRAARPDDIDGIVTIEREANPHPWSESALSAAILDPLGVNLVATIGGALAGFVVARAVVDEAEVLELAVAPAHRRRGVARALLVALDVRLRARDVERLHLEVRTSNAAARALYLAYGFDEVGCRRGYYKSPTEDAVLMTARLAASGHL